jgi:hypothetical protein
MRMSQSWISSAIEAEAAIEECSREISQIQVKGDCEGGKKGAGFDFRMKGDI